MKIAMNSAEAWEDATAILGELLKHPVRVIVRPDNDHNTPVVITSDKPGRHIITVLRWDADGWWKITDAVDNQLDALAHNTHPRLIANRIEAIHWDQLA